MIGRRAFDLLLLAAAAYFAWSATEFEPQARLIPLLVSGMVLVLEAWVMFKASAAGDAPLTDEEPPPPDEAKRVLAACAWMALLFLLFVVVGMLAAIFLFILAFLVMQPGVRLWTAVAMAATTSAAIWLLFVHSMRFELYPGVLFGGTLPPL